MHGASSSEVVYGKKCIKHPQNERQKCFDVKDKEGIKHAQGMMIKWREYIRVLQLQVSTTSLTKRSQRLASLSECSDPCYRQEVHHHLDDLPDEDFVADYTTNRESLLRRARGSWESLGQ